MKISNSKRQLANLLIEDGVTQLPEGANWVAQDKGRIVWPYGSKPSHNAGSDSWSGSYLSILAKPPTLIANWFQTVLSRAEFDQIVAETAQNADGWIEWKGGERPVESGVLVDLKWSDGFRFDSAKPENFRWSNLGAVSNIIAYRLHKPEQAKSTAVGDDETNLAAKEELEAMELSESAEVRANLAKIYAPSIEKLAADYRNKLDYADRKQDEADKANMESDAALSELEKAIAAIGFNITPIGAVAQEHATPNWRNWVRGDEIKCKKTPPGAVKSIGLTGYVSEVCGDCVEVAFEHHIAVAVGCLIDECFEFVNRPAK